MLASTADAATIKGVAAAGAVAAAAPALILGVPLGVLIAALAGALFALAYSKPDAWSRLLDVPPGRPLVMAQRAGALAFVIASNAFVSAWAAIAVPHVPVVAVIAAVPAEPLAGLFGVGAQHFIQRAFAAGSRWLDSRNKP